MINEIAGQLIHDLRHDAHTRKHFNISSWNGKTCGTVGCIAGTAIYRTVIKNLKAEGKSWDEFPSTSSLSDPLLKMAVKITGEYGYDVAGMKILNLPNREVANQLFIPRMHWFTPILNEAPIFSKLSENERPNLDTVEKMIAFAKEVESSNNLYIKILNPSHCANALEDVLKHERLYVDWAEAWREDALV